MRTVFNLSCGSSAARVDVIGDLDLASRRQFSDLLRRLRLRGCDLVEIDLSQVTSTDVSIVCLLDQERHRLAADGGTLRVVAVSDSFRGVALPAGYGDFVPADDEPVAEHRSPATATGHGAPSPGAS